MIFLSCENHCCDIINVAVIVGIITIALTIAVCVITALAIKSHTNTVNKKYEKDNLIHCVSLMEAKTLELVKSKNYSVDVTSNGTTSHYDIKIN